MAKKTKGQELQEQLTWAFPHIGKDKPEQAEKNARNSFRWARATTRP